MQPGYAIDRKTGHDRHIGHADLTFIENGHTPDLIVLIWISLFHFNEKTAVDLLYNLINSRKETHK